jgi:hypothetical protein
MFTTAPGRGFGSLLGLAIWAGLLGIAAARLAGSESKTLRIATLTLAGLTAAGNVGLTYIHFKAGVGGLRPALGGLLGVAALVLALASRRPATG